MKLIDNLREQARMLELDIRAVHVSLPDVLREAADLLEKHVPPCKLGDPVYCIRTTKYTQKVMQGTVSQMYYSDDMRLGVRVRGVGGGYIGKDVFLTREEAERAMKEMTKNE